MPISSYTQIKRNQHIQSCNMNPPKGLYTDRNEGKEGKIMELCCIHSVPFLLHFSPTSLPTWPSPPAETPYITVLCLACSLFALTSTGPILLLCSFSSWRCLRAMLSTWHRGVYKMLESYEKFRISNSKICKQSINDCILVIMRSRLNAFPNVC